MDKSGRYVLPETDKRQQDYRFAGILQTNNSPIRFPDKHSHKSDRKYFRADMKRIFKMSRKSSANQFPLRIFSPQKRMSRKNIFGSCFYSQAMNEPTGQPISQTILRLPENGRNHPNHHHTRQNDNFLNPPNLIHISILIS